MGSGNWIIDNLNNSLSTWSQMMEKIQNLLAVSPEEFKDGSVWKVITGIQNGLQGIAYGLLVLFFVIGVVKSTSRLTELKRPETAFSLLIRFACAKILVSYSFEVMNLLFKAVQGIIMHLLSQPLSLPTDALSLPGFIEAKIRSVTFMESIPLWMVTILGSLFITVLSYVMILTVYSRFFTLYMYTALAPLALSSFAGEESARTGKQFLKSYLGVCLQGAVVVLGCIIYSLFLSASPEVGGEELSAVQLVWNYVGEVAFNMLVLVSAVKLSEKVVRDMVGF